jgi:diketogulonate reductase-like aldo/keto reductase
MPAMETKPFGSTGRSVAVIGQGTWHMGESRRHRTSEAAALRVGLELGMTHIDTAEAYGSGGAEEMLADVLRGVRREDVFLTSKVLPNHASYRGTLAAADQSLRRLGTEYLDLYLLHWPGNEPIEETMRAMEDLVAAGKIRHLGVSNFDVDELDAARRALTRHPLAANQVLYNLAHRGIERDLVPYCAREGIAVIGYTPFGSFPRRGSAGMTALEQIGAKYGRTPRQVALRFLTRLPCLFAIPKAGDPEHVRENAAAADIELDAGDLAVLERAFPVPGRRAPLATA